MQSYELTEGKWHQSSPFPLELNGAVVFSPSPSGKLLAVIREDAADGKDSTKDTGYVIEIWSNEQGGGQLVDQIPTAGVHGKIVGGTWFGGLNWSPDESKVVYVAQQKSLETRYDDSMSLSVTFVSRSSETPMTCTDSRYSDGVSGSTFYRICGRLVCAGSRLYANIPSYPEEFYAECRDMTQHGEWTDM